MKTKLVALALSSGLILVGCGGEKEAAVAAAPEAEAEATVALETLEQKVSYLIGYNNALELSSQSQGFDFNKEAYLNGITQSFDGIESPFSDEEMQAISQEFQQKMAALAHADQATLGAENEAKSAAFLAENAKKEGVVTTESGLQYKILEAGEGAKPSAESTVQVHYEGRLINGEVFDSSLRRGTPVEFALNQVIPGWTEALQLMPEGSKYELYIPGDLAYGPSGSRSIGPNEALIFEVELLQANFDPDAAAE